MITRDDLRNKEIQACGDWFYKFMLDFPNGVATTVDGWLSLVKADYGPVLSWLFMETTRNEFRVNLCKANLSWTDLYKADLRRADLRGADLREVGFDWANLSEADLSGADVRGAYLYKADLRGADLRWTNLGGAELYKTDLIGAIYNENTIFPDGFNPLENGM